MRIDDVEGIGATHAAKLSAAGVTTTDELLDKGANERPGLARDDHRDQRQADPRVGQPRRSDADHGVGSEYSDLLEAAGVDSPPELAQRNAANLATTFQEVEAARPNIVRRVPCERDRGLDRRGEDAREVVEH